MELIASSCDQNVSYVGFHSGRNRNIRFATRDDTIRVLDLRSNRRKKRGKSIFAVNFSFFFSFFFFSSYRSFLVPLSIVGLQISPLLTRNYSLATIVIPQRELKINFTTLIELYADWPTKRISFHLFR